MPTNLSNSNVEANSIDGFSGGWVDLTADLSACAGDVMLGFRYVTGGACPRQDSWSMTSSSTGMSSTFSLARTGAITLHYNSKAAGDTSLPGVRTFNDVTTYYDMNPYGSAKLPKTGTKIRIME